MQKAHHSLQLKRWDLLIEALVRLLLFGQTHTIMAVEPFEYEWVVDYLRHQAYLTKGIKTHCI